MMSKTKMVLGALTVLALATLGGTGATAKDFYKMSTLGPGSTPYVVMTAFAKVINQHVEGVEIQVNATGAATRHAVDAAKGKIDFFMSAPSVHHFMTKNLAMYKKMKDAPKLAKNLRAIFNFPIGVYHVVVYEDSGIKSLADVKGKKVYLGPPAGAARVIATSLVEGATGYKAGRDFEAITMGWGAASQAFQDRQFDVYINPTNAPSPVISQVALGNKIRILGLSDADFKNPILSKTMKLPGRTIGSIAPGTYGKNQTNGDSVKSIGAWVGVGTRQGMSTDVMYRMTKAFWENLAEVHAVAPWLKAIAFETALAEMNMPLHPGAAKYYRERGVDVPAGLMATD
jgi:hypothetical protein|tara:strand:+ start:826 stop:1854 length:1029 start_codon:yes stop_codon:yes gene_type:complete